MDADGCWCSLLTEAVELEDLVGSSEGAAADDAGLAAGLLDGAGGSVNLNRDESISILMTYRASSHTSCHHMLMLGLLVAARLQ